jgi:tRNA-splicing ligase RtcB
LEKVFGLGEERLGLEVVYDVAHNIAKVEEYEGFGEVGGHEFSHPTLSSSVMKSSHSTKSLEDKGTAVSVGLSKIVTHHPLKKLLVHRKGATRSYPGQPVILGGSMETGSYLLQGTEKAVSETFASTAHGSGRVMSRARAKREFRGDLLKKNMEDRGIYVRTVSYSGLAEEAGSAYKNIAEVVEALNKVGISSKVASFQPLGNIKG